MDAKSAQIATICECIDHCFAFSLWCDDFAQHVDPDDMAMGLDRAFDLVSDATRLQSFLALRKLDDFLGGVKPKANDLTAASFGIDVPSVLGDAGEKFLSAEERGDINKGVAHLTEKLTLDPESELELSDILERSTPVLSRLVAKLRECDEKKEATQWLDRTDKLIEDIKKLQARQQAQASKV
jgi:hypothetical protein